MEIQLHDPIVYPDTVVHGRAPLAFTTPPAPWAHAVAFTTPWAGDDWVRTHDGAVTIGIWVQAGRVSVSLLDKNGTTILDRVVLDAGEEPVDVELVSAPMSACAQIVFANALATNSPSGAVVQRIEYVDLGPVEQRDEIVSAAAAPSCVPNWPEYYGVSRGRTLSERRRAAAYATLDRVNTVGWFENLHVHVYPNDDLSRALYVSGTYEPSMLLVLRRFLDPGDTFIDVGANAGLFSMMAAKWVGTGGRVYAFEPSEREYDRLQAHIALNGLTNVEPLRLAIGDREDRAYLRVASYPHAGHNTLASSFAYAGVPTERIESLTTTTLDRFVADRRMERVDVIKLDIEGSELAALRGATEVLERLRPVVLVEISGLTLAGMGSAPPDVLGLLRAARYTLCRVASDGDLTPISQSDDVQDENIVAVPV